MRVTRDVDNARGARREVGRERGSGSLAIHAILHVPSCTMTSYDLKVISDHVLSIIFEIRTSTLVCILGFSSVEIEEEMN